MSVPVRMRASLVRSASASGRRVFEWAGRDVSARTIPEGGRIVKDYQWPGRWGGGSGGGPRQKGGPVCGGCDAAEIFFEADGLTHTQSSAEVRQDTGRRELCPASDAAN